MTLIPNQHIPSDGVLDEVITLEPPPKVDEVPTARPVGNGMWVVGAMPSPAWTQRFIASLTAEYLVPYEVTPTLTGPAPMGWTLWYNKWWETFRAEHAPIGNWAAPLDSKEQLLLEYACKVLSSSMFGVLVQKLKLSDSYPSQWGSVLNFFRSTTERLFDRLRLNHIVYAGEPKRWPFWGDHAGREQGMLTTIIGRRHQDNAFWKLRDHLSTGGSTLGDIVGLTDAPDNFALPLHWSEAVYSGLGEDMEAKLPKDAAASLRKFGRDLGDALQEAEDVTFWATLLGIAALFVPGLRVAGGLSIFLSAKVNKTIDSLAHWEDHLVSAGRKSAHLNDTAYYLLNMLRTTDYEGLFEQKVEDALNLDKNVLFLGLPPDVVQDVERALRPDIITLSMSQPLPVVFQPLILLGDSFASYARTFGTRPFQVGKTRLPKDLVASEEYAAHLWTTWWNNSQPALDVALIIDSATMVLEQLLYIDDALLALNSLAVGDGAIAVIIRRALAEQGLTRLVDALGGASPGSALRCFVRQVLTDLFMDYAVEKDSVRREDLYPIFCWMNTSSKRRAIDDALGPRTRVTRQNAGGLWAAFEGIRLLFALDAFFIRAAFLPNADPDQKGAVGRAIDLLGANPGSAASAASQISHVELGYVREWLEDARASCLVSLKEALEPDWTPPREFDFENVLIGGNPPRIPDDLPPADIPGPDPGLPGGSPPSGPR